MASLAAAAYLKETGLVGAAKGDPCPARPVSSSLCLKTTKPSRGHSTPLFFTYVFSFASRFTYSLRKAQAHQVIHS